MGETRHALVPQRPARGNQAFVHGHNLRIGRPFVNGLFALQTDGFAEQPMHPLIAAEKRAPRGKIVATGRCGDYSPGRFVAEKPELGRFTLSSFQHSDHNQHADQPIGNMRFCSRPRPWASAFGLSQQRCGHPHQCLQARACRGTCTHPWVLLGRLTLLRGRKSITPGGPCAYVNSISGRPQISHLHEEPCVHL